MGAAFRQFVVTAVAVLIHVPAYGDQSYFDQTYKELTEVVVQKKTQLINFCTALQEKAQSIQDDPIMTTFFVAKRSYYNLTKTTQAPEEITDQIEALKKVVQAHYLRNYLQFYDILFIDTDGDVFFSIRKESDYHKNMFAGALSNTRLAKTLKENPDEEFIDFQHFLPSDEPAAFFIIPMKSEGKRVGWFAFQCSVNKINSIFISCELGKTGEVFLVNREQFMLTDSRFIGDSTILRKHLNRDNIHAKFREKKGIRVVNDYRGFIALSSFEVFPFLGSEWLIIAKIDEDEILMKLYRENRKDLLPKIVAYLKTNPGTPTQTPCPVPADSKRVDIDEFACVRGKQGLHTFGVSTCTCIVAAFPNHFAYMAHISPFDRAYLPPTIHTDLLGQIMRNIMRFDIYPYQIRQLHVYIAANHLNSFQTILDYLVDNDIFPSQIRFIYNPNSCYANVQYDGVNDRFCSDWSSLVPDVEPVRIIGDNTLTVGEIIKKSL